MHRGGSCLPHQPEAQARESPPTPTRSASEGVAAFLACASGRCGKVVAHTNPKRKRGSHRPHQPEAQARESPHSSLAFGLVWKSRRPHQPEAQARESPHSSLALRVGMEKSSATLTRSASEGVAAFLACASGWYGKVVGHTNPKRKRGSRRIPRLRFGSVWNAISGQHAVPGPTVWHAICNSVI